MRWKGSAFSIQHDPRRKSKQPGLGGLWDDFRKTKSNKVAKIVCPAKLVSYGIVEKYVS